DTIGQTGCGFVRANLAAHVVHDVADIDRVEGAHPEIDGELQSRLARRCIDPIVLLEKKNAESVEAGVLDPEPVLGFVHAETTRSARASGKENVVIDDFLAGETAGFESLQVFDQ